LLAGRRVFPAPTEQSGRIRASKVAAMHARLLLVPAAIVVAAAAPQMSAADQLQTLEAGLQRLAPKQKLTPVEFKLTPAQFEQLKEDYDVPALRPQVRGWRVGKSGAWIFMDQVYGLNDIVTYLVAIDRAGKVSGVEILTCAEGYCELYTNEWRASFTGTTHGRWQPSDVAPIVSGSTLSSTHVAEGVKKMLAIHARFMPAK
jgi:hypothetical protein